MDWNNVLLPLLEPAPTVSPVAQRKEHNQNIAEDYHRGNVREAPVGFLGKPGTIFGCMNLGCAGIVIILITILAISLSGC